MNRVENYSTKISAARTAGEVQHMLAEHGARRVGVEYDNGTIVALTFQLDGPNGTGVFALPIRVDRMHALLVAEKRAGRLPSISKPLAEDPKHAERVAWRVLKEWLAAQLTLVAADMAALDEVMLPYLITDDGNTLYRTFVQRRALTGGRNA